MKKSVVTVSLMALLFLFPMVVQAEECSSCSSGSRYDYDDVKASISYAYGKVKDYIAEKRAERETKSDLEVSVAPTVTIEDENANAALDAEAKYGYSDENTFVQSRANAIAELNSIGGLLKDSNGSVQTGATVVAVLTDKDLLEENVASILSSQSGLVSYCLNSEKFNITANDKNFSGVGYSSVRKNIFGTTVKDLSSSTIFSNNRGFVFDVTKTEDECNNIYDVTLSYSDKGLYNYSSTLTRKYLLRDVNSTTDISYKPEFSYSKKKQYVIPKRKDPDNPDPVNPDPVNSDDPTIKPSDTSGESGVISTDKPAYYSANTSNPNTSDSVVYDLILLLVGISGLLGITITRKKLNYSL